MPVISSLVLVGTIVKALDDPPALSVVTVVLAFDIAS